MSPGVLLQVSKRYSLWKGIADGRDKCNDRVKKVSLGCIIMEGEAGAGKSDCICIWQQGSLWRNVNLFCISTFQGYYGLQNSHRKTLRTHKKRKCITVKAKRWSIWLKELKDNTLFDHILCIILYFFCQVELTFKKKSSEFIKPIYN